MLTTGANRVDSGEDELMGIIDGRQFLVNYPRN